MSFCPTCNTPDYMFSAFGGHDCVNPSCCHFKNGKVNETATTKTPTIDNRDYTSIEEKFQNLWSKTYKETAKKVNTPLGAIKNDKIYLVWLPEDSKKGYFEIRSGDGQEFLKDSSFLSEEELQQILYENFLQVEDFTIEAIKTIFPEHSSFKE